MSDYLTCFVIALALILLVAAGIYGGAHGG